MAIMPARLVSPNLCCPCGALPLQLHEHPLRVCRRPFTAPNPVWPAAMLAGGHAAHHHAANSMESATIIMDTYCATPPYRVMPHLLTPACVRITSLL
mmetsp:Transcript_66405/g.148266  ORF Transcript_66405/g.148266 Transcript_66405/m.148266 type:complete len:97 (-) Transcript_66405:1330-1620(-)